METKMKMLPFAAARILASQRQNQRMLALVLGIVLLVAMSAHGMAADSVAQAAPKPVGDDLFSGLISLWGPLLGVITAVVILCDRIAKVIPSSSASKFAQVVRTIASVLGAKVPDRQ
jgi:hypothetical protein